MEISKTDQRLIQAAKDLFIKHGLRRVTVDEICRRAKISKMTFYKYFKNKMDISKSVLNAMFDENMDEYNSILSKNIDFYGKIHLVFKLKMKSNKQYGEEFIKDLLSKNDPELLAFMQEKRQWAWNATLEFLEVGKKEGAIRKDLKPEFFMYILNQLAVLVDDQQLERIYPDFMTRLQEIIKFGFYGMIAVDKGTRP